MERTPVTSTDICAIGYDADTQTLEIEFNTGSVYDLLIHFQSWAISGRIHVEI